MFVKRNITDTDMIMKLKNQSNRLYVKTIMNTVLLLFLVSVFFSCKYDPETMIPMTPEEICAYMNEHFEGEFELLYSKSENSDKEKTNSAYMKCSLFGDRQVLTIHGYSESKFGWHETFLTNYDELFYRENVEAAYSELFKDWFGAFEYKYVYSPAGVLSDLAHFKSFEEYLKSSPLIYYTVVINTCSDTVKQYALTKAKSVYFDIKNRREYPIRIYLYLWEDTDFADITEEQMQSFRYSSEDGKEKDFRYTDEDLENYSL